MQSKYNYVLLILLALLFKSEAFSQTTITVGLLGDYSTIQAAYNSIPADITGDGKYYIEIRDDYSPLLETKPVTFDARTGSSSSDNITIYPAVGCSDKDFFAFSTNLLEFDGVDYLTIDGRPGMVGDTGAFTFLNIETTFNTFHTIEFDNGATNNLIQYVGMFGMNNSTTANTGGVVSFGGGAASPNNTIKRCNISGSISVGGICIAADEPSSGTHSNILIDSNNIYDFGYAGIELENDCDDWTITENSFFYYEADMDGAAAPTNVIYAVHSDASGGHVINNNYIGGSNVQCSGATLGISSTSSFYGIYMETSTDGDKIIIEGNIMKNISMTSSRVNSTSIIGITTDGPNDYRIGSASNPNIFGDTTGTGHIVFTENGSSNRTATFAFLDGTGTDSVMYNRIGGITVLDGTENNSSKEMSIIKADASGGTKYILHNEIGNATANNILVNERVEFIGINVLDDVDSLIVRGNTIQNVDHNSGDLGFVGYKNENSHTGRQYQKIQGNTISTITTDGDAQHYGIYMAHQVGTSSSELPIDSNVVDSFIIEASGSDARFDGIYLDDDGAGLHVSPFSFTNNTVRNIYYGGSHGIWPITGITIVQSGSNTGTGNSVITDNTVENLVATNTGSNNISVKGMQVNVFRTESYLMNRNFVYDIENAATGANAALRGIHLNAGGTKGAGVLTFRNNVVMLSNGSNTNDIEMFGIDDGSSSRRKFFHNTVSIQGTNGGTENAYAFSKWYDADNASAGDSIMNNIFQSTRTGGSGNYYSIYFFEDTDYITDYNFLQSASTNLAYHDGDVANLTAWRTATSQAANSINGSITLLANGQPTSTSTVSNAGADLNVAIDVIGTLRDNTPWIGAYEKDSSDGMPVELVSFIGSIVGDDVELNWQTASEVNSSHYVVYKSTDAINYNAIGSVEAIGNSIVTNNYSFVDENTSQGISYYKLLTVDLDETSSYSDVVTIINDASTPEKMYSVYPNPIESGGFTLQLESDLESGHIEIYNIKGELVYEVELQDERTLYINPDEFTTGMYLVKIQLNGDVFHEKVIKQ